MNSVRQFPHNFKHKFKVLAMSFICILSDPVESVAAVHKLNRDIRHAKREVLLYQAARNDPQNGFAFKGYR